MEDNMKAARRQFLKMGGAAIAMIPVLAIGRNAFAATNAQMRTTLKYQDKPQGDQDCANCVQFVPGKKADDKGGCKIIPGDTEISPKGHCVAWAKIP
ncbi:MAG: high-potential iron-sulfur protein [Sulfurimicrobium sp.]|nr:high-potential iron-sulfur protein [Sulfurimicrobium sp.]